MLDKINLSNLNIALSYPFVLLVLMAIVFLLSCSFSHFQRSFYIILSCLCLALSALLIVNNLNNQGLEARAFLGTLNNDLVSFYSCLFILCFSFLYLLMQREEKRGEFYSLFLFMIAAFLLMVSSSNLILIFIGLEGSSLALYTLIAMRASTNAISSAIKYFSIAAVGSGFFVMASALIYMKTGSLDLALNFGLQKDVMTLGAAVMIFILCALKLSLVPFHFWLKDVYYGANVSLVAFISVVPKIAIFAIIIRLFSFFANLGLESIISVLAIFSMCIASFAALSQRDVKKMFAYSSIVHSSFVLCVCISLLRMHEDVLSTIFIYWTFFAFANYGVFIILSGLKKTSFEELNALFYKKPLIALSLTFCTLSLAGIPPFGAFWGKVMVFKTLMSAQFWYLALFMALASLIMLYSYLKLAINALFIKELKGDFQSLSLAQACILGLCVFMSVCAVFFLIS